MSSFEPVEIRAAHQVAGRSIDVPDLVEGFHRRGFARAPDVLPQSLVSKLVALADVLFADEELQTRTDPSLADPNFIQKIDDKSGAAQPTILRNTVGLDPLFRDMLIAEPMLSIAQAIVGEDCVFVGQNLIRNKPGVGIDWWHVDGGVNFPVPDGVPRHHADTPPPVLWITIQMPLTDIDSIADGPTQFVPGSHMAGREPNSKEHPTFEGHGPQSILCKAGDVYVQHPQCWHRGMVNASDKTRYLFQSQYAVRWAWKRFGQSNRVPIADSDLAGASDRLLQVLARQRPQI